MEYLDAGVDLNVFQGLTYDLQLTLREIENAGLFENATVTIKARGNDGGDPPVDSAGQPDLADYTPIDGLEDLPAMLAVWRMKPDMAAVQRLEDRFNTLLERTLLIDGFYPAILQRHIADVTVTSTGQTWTYEVMSAESDSQSVFTRLALRSFTQ